MNSDYIKSSHKRALKENREKHLNGKILFVKDPLPEDIDLEYVIGFIEKHVPTHLTHYIDSFYVGDFDFLNKKNVNASYEDGAIYISNKQTNEEDMIDDIIHEIAHSIEEVETEEIYFDGEIEREFLGKRERLCALLVSHGYKVPYSACADPEYNENFDKFLYQTVGYENLASFVMGLFYSPYAATSLREYFSNGFEHFFIGDRQYLKNISPVLYNKITDLID